MSEALQQSEPESLLQSPSFTRIVGGYRRYDFRLTIIALYLSNPDVGDWTNGRQRYKCFPPLRNSVRDAVTAASSLVSKWAGRSKPTMATKQLQQSESLNQTKDRIMADIQALEEELIGLNLMMVVDPKDNDMVGKTDVKFGSEMGTNEPVFTEIEDHPVHVEKVMDHGLLCLKHEDAEEYRKNKREQY